MILEDGVVLKQGVLQRLLQHFLAALNTFGVVFVSLALWQFAATFTSALILPEPLSVLKRAFEIISADKATLIITAKRAFVAIVAAFCVGSFLGIIAANFKSLAAFIKPFVDILQGIAPIIWVVIALFWFGIGDVSVIFVVFVTLVPLCFGSSFMSVFNLDKNLSELCKAYKLGVLKRLRVFYLPAMLPFLLSNLSLIFAMGIKIVVMAELLGAVSGVGARLNDARNFLDSEQIFAFVVLMIGLIFLFESLVIKPLRIIFMPWQR